jgi:hypothetical protein
VRSSALGEMDLPLILTGPVRDPVESRHAHHPQGWASFAKFPHSQGRHYHGTKTGNLPPGAGPRHRRH